MSGAAEGRPSGAVGPPVPASGALEPPESRTTLVTDPDTRPALTTYRETDARSALTRGLAEYLQNMSLDMLGGRQVRLAHVYEQWPEPEQDILLPALSCAPAGEGTYEAKGLTPIINPDDRIRDPDGRYPVVWAELTQDIDVEVHASDPAEREGLMMLIEDSFAPVDWMSGFRLMLPHYFGQLADFQPLTVGYPDTADTAIERQRIVDFRVRAQIGVMVLRKFPTFRVQVPLTLTVGMPDVDP